MQKLYDYFRSSASFRVRIALNLKQIPYEKISVHLINQGGEQLLSAYREINPQALVPTLKDGEKTLTQSLAIIEYLEELYPDPPVLPKDALARAKVRAFALAIGADLHPLNNLRVLQFLTQELKLSVEQKNHWYHHWIAQGLTALETMLPANAPDNLFCFGNHPTLADIFLVPQIYNAARFQCDLTPYPQLMKIYNQSQLHPAFIEAWPSET